LIDAYPITFTPTETGQDVFVGGAKVTDEIRQPEVTNAVSKVSAYQKVREKLVQQQQKIAENGGVVMDGRDIGTAVLTSSRSENFLRSECRSNGLNDVTKKISKKELPLPLKH
jgi:cytidylate kinase